MVNGNLRDLIGDIAQQFAWMIREKPQEVPFKEVVAETRIGNPHEYRWEKPLVLPASCDPSEP
jgi:hypothetical protein